MAKRASGWRRVVIGAPGPADAAAAPSPGAAQPAQAEPRPDDGVLCIERGVEMNGRLVTERALRMDGEFRGEIETASTVLVTEGGSVEAPIRAKSVEIRGAVVGDVVASREVVIAATGRLHGDVEAPCVVVERGAFFNGRTRMYRPERQLGAASGVTQAREISRISGA